MAHDRPQMEIYQSSKQYHCTVHFEKLPKEDDMYTLVYRTYMYICNVAYSDPHPEQGCR